METYALLIIIRIIGNHAKISTKGIIRIRTHNWKSAGKNKVSKEIAALNIRDTARYEEILLSGRKYRGKKLIL